MPEKTHASKQTEGNDGLEFLPDSEQNGTLQFGEISRLEQLGWARNAALILSGCNTGLILGRGCSPAQALATQQKVKTLGQNGLLGGGKRISGQIFRP